MNKCTGQKLDGSQCPKKGTCKAFVSGDPSLVMQAPYEISESGKFECNEYSTVTEQNLGTTDYNNDQMINS